MLKRDELSNPESCFNRAKDDEMIFVLLGRDVAAPHAIGEWINERLRRGKNKSGDPQIVCAEECIRCMVMDRNISLYLASAMEIIETL